MVRLKLQKGMNRSHSFGSRRRIASKNGKGGRKTNIESNSSGSESNEHSCPAVLKKPQRKTRKRTASPQRRQRKRIVFCEDPDSGDDDSDSVHSDIVVKAKVKKTEKQKRTKRTSKRENNKGRRRIRKILDDGDLQDETREAVREERERLQRLKEREITRDSDSVDDNSDTVDSDIVVKTKLQKIEKLKRTKRTGKGETKKGRRRIKKILDDGDLQDETREAAREERKRLQRLKEREITGGSDEESSSDDDNSDSVNSDNVVKTKLQKIEKLNGTKRKGKREKNKEGRRRIKKILDDEDPRDQTRGAAREARKRLQRLKERDITGDSDSDEERSSDDDNSDSVNSDNVVKTKLQKGKREKNKEGRKRIKKILNDRDLQDQTRKAAKEERERRQRLKKRVISDEEEIVERSPEKKPKGPSVVLQSHPLIEVSPYLAYHLRPHQIEGVRFIWNNLIESSERAQTDLGGGCILAHCMGLGKTLQTIACVHTFVKSNHLKIERILVVAPLNTIRNWIAEFVQWCEDGDELNLYNFDEPKCDMKNRILILESWKKNGGVLILGYGMYRAMTSNIMKKKWQKTVYETLVDPGPDVVVCDEGHVLKNSHSHISKQLNKIKTRRRLVLTGTPLQNNLVEYHCMVNFVKPDLLGSLKEFRNRFMNPILNGQHIDSTDHDVKIMKKRSHVLHQMLGGFVQRKDFSALKSYLSSKFEYVLNIRLTPLQIKLYQHYLDTKTNRGANTGVVNSYGKGSSLFVDYQNLMRVWTHPKSLLLHTVKRDDILARQAEKDFIEDLEEGSNTQSDDDWIVNSSSEDEPSKSEDVDSTDSEHLINERKRRTVLIRSSGSEEEELKSDNSDECESDEESEDEDENEEKFPPRRSTSTACKAKKRFRLRCAETSSESDDPETSKEPEWYSEILPKDKKSLEDYQNGLKIVTLFEILRLAEERKEKVLVFSQSLISLDLIEDMLEFSPPPSCLKTDIANSDVPCSRTTRSRWFKNIDYFRMDGSTLGHHRQKWINAFNDQDDSRSRLFLISTKAGSLGVNLVGANRVVIFDASWNPSHDTQSMFRVYRFGQTRKCYIYRLIAEGTMEEKIYQRQVNKQSLAFRVIDEQQINRHFTASSVAEMYTFKPSSPDAKKSETPVVPKDEVLAEILSDPRTRHMVASYHEHDSLLDHQVDEELTEEERKAAWEEYEMAKARGFEAPRFDQTFEQQQATNIINACVLAKDPCKVLFGGKVKDTAALLTRLSKMLANASSQYQDFEVQSVESIINKLKDTPLYSKANYETVKTIAVEVNCRKKLEKNKKLATFRSLQKQHRDLHTHYLKLLAGVNRFRNTMGQEVQQATPFLGLPSQAHLLQHPASTASSRFGFVNGNVSVPQQTTTTIISEIIEIDESDDRGTSETIDK